jgi:hypothetical protein
MTERELIRLGRLLAQHSGHSLQTIATYALANSRFFDRLDAGGSCTLKTAGKLGRWFSENWPQDLEWPRDIVRPRGEKVAA